MWLLAVIAALGAADAAVEELVRAAHRGDAAACEAALARGDAHVDGVSAAGHSALQAAASQGHLPTVAALVRAGADLDARGSKGAAAVVWAARYGGGRRVCAPSAVLMSRGRTC